MSQVPATRSLSAVLRKQLGGGGDGARLVLATGGGGLLVPEANAYVNVVIEGVEIKVPRLKGAPIPSPGAPAYLIGDRDFLLYVGTVSTI